MYTISKKRWIVGSGNQSWISWIPCYLGITEMNGLGVLVEWLLKEWCVTIFWFECWYLFCLHTRRRLSLWLKSNDLHLFFCWSYKEFHNVSLTELESIERLFELTIERYFFCAEAVEYVWVGDSRYQFSIHWQSDIKFSTSSNFRFHFHCTIVVFGNDHIWNGKP